MSVDTIRVSIPIRLQDLDVFQRAADPVRFFKVDTTENLILWTKVKGLSEVELPSHNGNINWDIRDPKPGEVERRFELSYPSACGIVRSPLRERGYDVSYHGSGAFWENGDIVEHDPRNGMDGFKLVDIELSLPKFMRGHNIQLLHDPAKALQFLRMQLEEQMGVCLPPIAEWFVSRLDVCHAYKFPDQETAQILLDALKWKKFPHKKPSIYPTSLHFPGKEYSFKVYLKQPEYKVHSYRKDAKRLNGMNHYYANYASGVLRIEISARITALRQLNGQKYPILSDLLVDTNETNSLIDSQPDYLYNELLKAAYKRFFGEGVVVNESEEIAEIFHKRFAKRKANEMMKLWCLVQYLGETNARKHMGENTWYVYKRDLAACGVKNTVTRASIINSFSFELPHPIYTINHDDSDLDGLYAAHGIIEMPEGHVSANPRDGFDDLSEAG